MAGIKESKSLSDSEKRYQAFIQASPDMMFRINSQGVYLDFLTSDNDNLFVGDDCIGKNLHDFLPTHVADCEMRHIQKALKSGTLQVYEYELTLHNETRVYEARVIPCDVDEVCAIVRDISERKRLENRLFYQAFHDPVTGLPNRRMFKDRLKQSHLRFQRHKDNYFAIAFLDLDNFKIINDTLGHNVGDELLQKVARRLRHCLREKDTLARMGGDEFALIFDDLAECDNISSVVNRVHESFQDPFTILDNEIYCSLSMGVTISHIEYKDVEDLLRFADIAMYRAKARGGNRFELFDQKMLREQSPIKINNEIRRGIENKEFEIFFQPIISATTKKAAGVEALLRWNHPERGLLAPNHFISAAEESGLITQLGLQVFEQACQALEQWQSQGFDYFVSVNVSPKQFYQPQLITELESLLKKYNVQPSRLIIEVTENMYLEFESHHGQVLSKLSALGIEISIDDFGTGYSSIAYLKRFKIDSIKIDRMFVKDLGRGSDDENITRGMVYLAKGLKLKTVAEGVENQEQLQILHDEGCTHFQGFLFARPLPKDQVLGVLTRDFSNYF